MSIIGSDGLSLLVGDGAGSESFTALTGATISKLEITQKNNASKAIATDAWAISVGMTDRSAVIECDALMSDTAQAQRLRSLAFGGLPGNFKLELNAAETLVFSAVPTLYREVIEAGEIKKLVCRLESTGALTVV
jgi:hypothetical protein